MRHVPATDPLQHAAWLALTTNHAPLALGLHPSQPSSHALRYPADIAPFAALDPAQPASVAFDDLARLLAPGESLYLMGDPPPPHPHLRSTAVIPCLQMAFPADAPLSTPAPGLAPGLLPIKPLHCNNAPEMLALIAIAFPGFFRARTCLMGRYFGLRDPRTGDLLAMAGERLCFTPHPGTPAWREISALCVHPTRAAGQGLGTRLLTHMLTLHRAEGTHSWLHVATTNTRAIRLYHHLGLQTLREIDAHRLRRS